MGFSFFGSLMLQLVISGNISSKANCLGVVFAVSPQSTRSKQNKRTEIQSEEQHEAKKEERTEHRHSKSSSPLNAIYLESITNFVTLRVGVAIRAMSPIAADAPLAEKRSATIVRSGATTKTEPVKKCRFWCHKVLQHISERDDLMEAVGNVQTLSFNHTLLEMEKGVFETVDTQHWFSGEEQKGRELCPSLGTFVLLRPPKRKRKVSKTTERTTIRIERHQEFLPTSYAWMLREDD
ncbi:hypothetical protein RND71_040818 [Anisodus tanguticus]|uniref:Uncharacterized protein n=1 Tax=Anisodus tanguticus TaxID=243964 RepID=A0AAE1UTP8_9SOLA|nr:hypothetical protein RND71_040818 [Anisodus tanguticus]